jgi:hypothetical protein
MSSTGRRRAAKPLEQLLIETRDQSLASRKKQIEEITSAEGAVLPRDSALTPAKRVSIHDLSPIAIRALMVKYESAAYRDYITGSPRSDQRITLIHFNVFRASVSNTFALGFTMEWLDDAAISPFYSNSFDLRSDLYPKSLAPTAMQNTISHHPWIDLFPVPRMRENMLLAAGLYDEAALCNVLVDFEDVTHDKAGLIVWREPWDPSGWEVSESFLADWAWVVEGCNELAKSTNYWRQTRGEKQLSF